MSIEDELRIYEYLDKVSDAVTGRLGPQERSDLVEAVRHRIEAERLQTSSRRRKDGDLDRILQQLGPPDVLAARMLHGATEPDAVFPAAAPGHAPMDEPANGTTAPAAAESPEPTVQASPVDTPGETSQQRADREQRSLTERARSAAERLWPPLPRTDDAPLEPLMVVRAYALEIGALVAYTIGTIVVSYIGFVVAAVLTLFSKFWTEREKGIAIALIPALTLGIGMFVVWLDEGRDRSGTTSQRWDRVSAGLGDLFSMWPLVSGFLAATYLLYRLLVIAQRPSQS